MQDTPFPRIRTIQAGGHSYAIYPLSIAEMMVDMQAWVDRQFPDPFDLVNTQIDRGRICFDEKGNESREPYPMVVQQFLLRSALEAANTGRHLLGSPEADEKAQTAAGTTHLIYLSIRKGRPGFTEADAEAVFQALTVGQVAAIFQATTLDLVVSDPKPPGVDGPPTP